MFEKYQATEKDFRTIEEGLKTVWRKELDFVFKKRNLIEKTVVISFDSKFLYLWTRFKLSKLKTIPCYIKGYYTYKIPHKIKLKDEWQIGWRAGLSIKEFNKLLPRKLQKSNFKVPKISGGLLSPFIALQRKKELKHNPYITRESFLATIVHEFAHIYWQQHKLWWYSSKKENLVYLKLAKQLYEGKKAAFKILIHFPITIGMTELFASCVEYWTSQLFWPKHHQNYDLSASKRLQQLIKNEERKDLEREDSVLEPSRNPHDFALVFKKIILSRYPKTWPRVLTRPSTL